MSDLDDIKILPQLYEDFENKGKEIQQLTNDNIKIKNITTPIDIYFSSPDTFKEALSQLEPEELEELKAMATLSKTPIPTTLSSSLSSIFNNTPPSQTIDQIKSELETTLSNNIEIFDKTQKEYDDINLKIKSLELINPLDLIPFGSAGQFSRLFSSNANFMIKFVRNFMIQTLLKTIRPKEISRKGKLNFPKTINAAMKYEGDPYELKFRSKALRVRGVKPRIYIIIDTSGSQSHGIYAGVALSYALATVLKDYEIILYTGSEHPSELYDNHRPKNLIPRGIVKAIEEAEKKDITERTILYQTIRLNKKSILKYSNNPNALYNIISHASASDADDTYFIAKSLVDVVPDNTLIITFGDNHQHRLRPRANQEFNENQILPKTRILMKKKLKGKIYSFNTSETWEDIFTKPGLDTYDTGFPFKPFNASDFAYYDIKYFPTRSYYTANSNLTYGDWVREIINAIAGFTKV